MRYTHAWAHTHTSLSFSTRTHTQSHDLHIPTYIHIFIQIHEFLLLKDTNGVCRQNDLCCDPKKQMVIQMTGTLRLFPSGNRKAPGVYVHISIDTNKKDIYICIYVCIHNYIYNWLLSSTPTAVCTGFLVAAGFLLM